MYDWTWVIKTVSVFLSQQGRAAQLLLDILGKSERKLYNLFQDDQHGWETFKWIVKHKEFRKVIDSGYLWEYRSRETAIRLYSIFHGQGKNIKNWRQIDLTDFFSVLH